MFCSNCGTQLNEGDLFCVKCGKRVEVRAAAESTAPEATATEAVAEATAAETAASRTEAAPEVKAAPEEARAKKAKAKKAKAKKGGMWKILIPVAAVAAVGALVALNFGKVSNFVEKTILPAEKYYSKVEEAEVKELASLIADSYENSFKGNGSLTDTGIDAGITLELGESARALIGNYAYMDDTDWLKKIGLNLNVAVKDDVISGTLGALLGDDQLLSATALMDMGSKTVFLQIPELTKKYLGVDLYDTDLGYYLDSVDYSEIMGLYEDLYKELPDKDVVEDLIGRYLATAVSGFDNVKKSSDVLEVGDVEQKCTVLKVKITQKDAINALEAVLKEAKDDKVLVDLICDLASAVPGGYGIDPDDIEDEFEEGIEDLLDELKDAKKYADTSAKIVMQVWIDSDGNVVGRDLTVEDAEVRYYMPQKGDDFAMELSFTDGYDTILLTGEGKKTASALNGEFVAEYSDRQLFTVTVQDYSIENAKQGYLNGKFSVKLSEEMWDEMDLGVPSSMLTNFELVIKLNTDEKSSAVAISVEDGNEVFAKLTVSTSASAAKDESGAALDAIMMVDEEDLIDWLGTVDFDGFIKHMEETNLPDEFVDMIAAYCHDLEEVLEYY